jgi:hypothetical protein
MRVIILGVMFAPIRNVDIVHQREREQVMNEKIMH